jgi:signal transduction histidine kinase
MPRLETTVMSAKKPSLNPPKTDIDRFIYAISHDLNEPLRMVSSFIKLAQNNPGKERGEEYLNMALKNADQLKKMINALVDLSRITRTNQEKIVLIPNALLSEVNSMYRSELKARAIDFSFDCDDEVVVIEEQLIMVFKELIQNVLDHADERVNSYHIASEQIGNKIEFVCFAQNDGLKTITLNQIFDVFSSGKKSQHHIGMGLALARTCVEHNGGEMWATEGDYLEIRFTLPKA